LATVAPFIFQPCRHFHFACTCLTGATRCLTPAYKFSHLNYLACFFITPRAVFIAHHFQIYFPFKNPQSSDADTSRHTPTDADKDFSIFRLTHISFLLFAFQISVLARRIYSTTF
jgi:hypothetical protein